MSGTARTVGEPAPSACRLVPQASSVGEARELVRELLAHAGREELLDNAMLLVSELVTNALLHAGTSIEVSAQLGEHGLVVEVGDGSPHLPVPRHYADTSGTGRGLRLLQQLAAEWGVTGRADGKTVWFRLDTADAAGPARQVDAAGLTDRVPHRAVPVELANVPLLLHAAWQEHSSALLREYLLSCLDETGAPCAGDPIQRHAEATDAMAVLEEHVPELDVEIEHDRLMLGVTEPHVSVPCLTVPVPSRSLPHFRTLEDMLDAAVEQARRGLTLTPPTQPEMQLFRQWLCEQVLGQAEGGPVTPWSVRGELPAEHSPGVVGDLAGVTDAATPRIAADEASTILAVSGPMLDLLGYDGAGQLLGRRLVAVVPERYRQAHVAGFTLFQLVGRQPLVGREVTVPALRADGTEILVDMVVSVQAAGRDETVFVADMAPAAS